MVDNLLYPQGQVLEWLLNKYRSTNIDVGELFWRIRTNSVKPVYCERKVYKAYRSLSDKEMLEVMQAFCNELLKDANVRR